MDYIFAYANTSSLHDQLKPKTIDNLAAGDIFIQKGNPYGHAITVMDVSIHKTSGKKILNGLADRFFFVIRREDDRDTFSVPHECTQPVIMFGFVRLPGCSIFFCSSSIADQCSCIQISVRSKP